VKVAIHILWICVFTLALCPSAYAHKSSDSYVTLHLDGEAVSGKWDIALRDLASAIELDDNSDGQLTWGEVRNHFVDVDKFLQGRLRVASGNNNCPLSIVDHLIDRHSDGNYLVLVLKGSCSALIDAVNVHYDFLFDIDRAHRGLLNLDIAGITSSAVFSPDLKDHTFFANEKNYFQEMKEFVTEGIWHIWTGFDHILFLLSLLLPAVVKRSKNGWEPWKNSLLFEAQKLLAP